jgi:hypothetical protein
MKALQDRTRDVERHRVQADLDARLEMIFHSCQSLCGFSVALRSIPSADGEAGVPECELFVSGIDAYPALGRSESEQQLRVEISAALADLLEERPEAAELLPGRTFARVWH